MGATAGDNLLINPPEVHQVGMAIESDAMGLIDIGQYSMDDFQKKFTTIKQTNFPTALQGVFDTFIKNQHGGYTDILQNREAIGLVLQDQVAYNGSMTDVMTKDQFQNQLNEIQQESR